jgi:hypothetical protein
MDMIAGARREAALDAASNVMDVDDFNEIQVTP